MHLNDHKTTVIYVLVIHYITSLCINMLPNLFLHFRNNRAKDPTIEYKLRGHAVD